MVTCGPWKWKYVVFVRKWTVYPKFIGLERTAQSGPSWTRLVFVIWTRDRTPRVWIKRRPSSLSPLGQPLWARWPTPLKWHFGLDEISSYNMSHFVWFIPYQNLIICNFSNLVFKLESELGNGTRRFGNWSQLSKYENSDSS